VPTPLTTPLAGVKSPLPKMWIGALGVKPLATGSEGENTQNATARSPTQINIMNKRLALPEKPVAILLIFSPLLPAINGIGFLFKMY
jgi:hypothetical protein